MPAQEARPPKCKGSLPGQLAAFRNTPCSAATNLSRQLKREVNEAALRIRQRMPGAKLMIGCSSATQICPDGPMWRGASQRAGEPAQEEAGGRAPVPGSVLSTRGPGWPHPPCQPPAPKALSNARSSHAACSKRSGARS